MQIENKFGFENVYLKTDPDQYLRLVTRIIICLNGSLLYELTCGTEVTLHYAEEISLIKNTLLSLGLQEKVRD